MSLIESLTRFRQLVAPQRDLYKPLASFTLDVGVTQTSAGAVRFKHTGDYSVKLELARESLPYRKTQFATSIRFKLTVENVITFDVVCDVQDDPYCLCRFSVPRDAPTDCDIRFEISVEKANPEFQEACGPLRCNIVHSSVK